MIGFAALRLCVRFSVAVARPKKSRSAPTARRMGDTPAARHNLKTLYTEQNFRNAENRIQKSESRTFVRARGHHHPHTEVEDPAAAGKIPEPRPAANICSTGVISATA